MRTHAPLIAVAIATFIALTGCAPSADTEKTTAPVEADSPDTMAASPTTSAPSDSAAAPPEACVSYDGSDAASYEPAPGSEEIKAAADAVVLSPDIAFVPGIQIITSTKVPGSFEAVARICSEPLPEDEFRDAATAIAVAIKQSPSSNLLEVLKVTSWSPDDEGVLQQGATLSADFQTYTWDASTSGVPLNKNWTWS